jgi:glycogen(starch) synthase
MSKPKILMLGWEFPPIINGGLGVACKGLSEALALRTDLTFIVPNTNLENTPYQLIGLQNKKIIYNTTTSYKEEEHWFNTIAVDVNLNPYFVPNRTNILKKEIKPIIETVTTSSEIDERDTSFDDIYGGDIFKKINRYTALVVQEAEHIDFDVIHCHDWMTVLAGIELKKRTGKKLIYHVHSLSYDRKAGNADADQVFKLEQYGMYMADVVVPVSNYTGQIANKVYGIPFQKFYAVYNGVEKIDVYKKKKTFKDDLVVFVGRITEQKAPLDFIDIAHKVLAKRPNTRFVIAGTGNQLAEAIEKTAKQKNGDRIHFTGHLDRKELFDLFAMADVYCMPSISEPFGISALEAAQFGLPCVLSAQSGVYEIMRGALYADHGQVAKFAEHITNILSNEELRSKCIAQSKKDASNYTWEFAAKRMVALYHKLM